ncbi:MAG: 2-hydroxyacyl-CoA dehydratase [Dehalococcoidaceae bacterium]|nr:2-hydroxyacyl-CoA dehydratase [Dehalococcoidaceae bacterium]
MKIGITTTVPVECLIAAGLTPVDLNNVFISHPQPHRLVETAEKEGFPLNTCTWIKGIYGACLEYGIRDVICVTTGDCSNTEMLMEVLKLKGINTIPFAYPDEPDEDGMRRTLEKLSSRLGTTIQAAEKIRRRLDKTRKLALELDRMSWQENTVTGFENHIWLVSTSDFNQDYVKYTRDMAAFLAEAGARRAFDLNQLRLAYIGVPPVFARPLYDYTEEFGARVVFNETQRQFAMPEPGASLAEQYSNYTYPYSIDRRIDDISTQLSLRRIDGVIHYVQSFCHRAIGDIVFKARLNLPVLTLEGGSDYSLNQHLKTRLEAFIDMLERCKIIRAK